jgi:hypothetical protein
VKDEPQLKMAFDNRGAVKTAAYWESTLFSEVYLNNDLKKDFEEQWDRDFDDLVFDENGVSVKSGFAHFYNEFRNIAETLRKTTKSKNLKETNTITKVIIPLLDALGWHDKCFVKGDEPYDCETSFTIKGKNGEANKRFRSDMLLVDDPAEALIISDTKDNDKRKKEARSYCIAPLEAKYWNRISDKEGGLKFHKDREDADTDDSGMGWSFNEQILNYMNIVNKKWGIVTDGNTWRLVHSDVSGESPQRCFDFKLESLLSKELKIEEGGVDAQEFLDNAKFFYLFFGKASYIKNEIGKVFLDDVLTKSRKYIDHIEEDLKNRFISTMNMVCEGLLRVSREKNTIKGDPSKEDLALIRTVAESHLFNILFIKSCEANKVLDPKIPGYYDISLTNIIDRIKVFNPEIFYKDSGYITKRLISSLKRENYRPDGTNLYKYLINLTEGLRDGIDKFSIKGFVETFFSKKEWAFAKKHPLTDEEMVQIFFQLGYSKSEKAYQDDYQQIPYNYFTPRQLGSIYESFLEYRLEIAKVPMVYIKKGKYKQWVKLTAVIQGKLEGNEPIVKKSGAFFTPDNSERKSTGSYYTPDNVVQYIIGETLGPLCEKRKSAEILEISVCDPAMGSGHFLIGALNFLTSAYLSAIEKEVPKDSIPTRFEARSIILKNCIYGVDINPRSVKLGKMSLWLESACSGKKLGKLDEQIKKGDSLSDGFKWHAEFKGVFSRGGFAAVVSNPPYIGEKYHRDIFDKIKKSSIFSKYFERRSNTYYYFTMLANEIAMHGGMVGQIIPVEWESNPSGNQLRKYLSEYTTAKLKLKFKKLKVFKDGAKSVGTSSMVYVLKKSTDRDLKYERIEFSLQGAEVQRLIDSNAISAESLKLLSSNNLRDNPKKSIANFLIKYGLKAKNVTLNENGNAKVHKKNIANNLLPKLKKHFHVDQGIVTGADLVTKKNKYLKDNWSKYEHDKNSGILILREGIDLLVGIKEISLNLGNKSSPNMLPLNKEEIKLLKPLYKNKDFKENGTVNKASSYVLFFEDKGKPINLNGLPVIKKHLEKYKKVLTASKENCFHNKMLRNIMEPVMERGNYFTCFYPRPKTNFNSEKIVYVCDISGNKFTYNNNPFYGSGGNKGGLSFITSKNDNYMSLKFLFSLIISNYYQGYLASKDEEVFLNNDFIKNMPLFDQNYKSVVGSELTLIEGVYSNYKKIGFKKCKFTGSFIKKTGLVDLYLSLGETRKEVDVFFKSKKEALVYYESDPIKIINLVQKDISQFTHHDIKLLINICHDKIIKKMTESASKIAS